MMGTDLLSLCVFVLNFFFYIKYYFFKGVKNGELGEVAEILFRKMGRNKKLLRCETRFSVISMYLSKLS